MAVQGAFCGNCGAPLAPGATFCGRCGAPVTAAPQAAYPSPAYPSPAYPAPAYPSPAYPAPAYPAYAYPRAQPAPGRIGRDHTTQIAVAIGLIAILIVATVVVTLIALSNGAVAKKPCTQNCGPRIGTPLPEQATFKSTQFGFVVGYDPSWKVEGKTAAGIELATDAGAVAVIGSKAGPSLDQAITGYVNALPSSTYQDVAKVGELPGAHMGDQNGVGAIYSANFIGSNSSAIKVRFAIVAASKNGVMVLMFAINESDVKDFPNGMPDGQKFDYMCSEFSWS